jgi:hypothetical protein
LTARRFRPSRSPRHALEDRIAPTIWPSTVIGTPPRIRTNRGRPPRQDASHYWSRPPARHFPGGTALPWRKDNTARDSRIIHALQDDRQTIDVDHGNDAWPALGFRFRCGHHRSSRLQGQDMTRGQRSSTGCARREGHGRRKGRENRPVIPKYIHNLNCDGLPAVSFVRLRKRPYKFHMIKLTSHPSAITIAPLQKTNQRRSILDRWLECYA